MGEVGCLKDGHFQNLQVEGTSTVAGVLSVTGLLNTGLTTSAATTGDIDLTAVTHDHKLLMTGAHSAFVKLPQAVASNVGMTIEVFVKTTVAADAAGSQIAVENGAATVFIGGYTTCIIGGGAAAKESTSIAITANAQSILMDADNVLTAGGAAGSRFKFTYVAVSTIFVEGLSFITGTTATAPTAAGSVTTGFA
jgi:hypothetical protein